MSRVYLDTNVYDHIDKGYIAAEEVEGLRGAIARGEVVPHLSVADVEELLGQWESDRPAAVRQLKIARDLVGFDGLLKPPAMLLEDAIRAYASRGEPASPVLPRQQRRLLARELDRIAGGKVAMSGDVSRIVADVRVSKERFRGSMREALERTLAQLKPENYSPEERRALTFEAYSARAAESWAEAFADRLGLAEACRACGLDGLLSVRAVRIGVGVALSLVFSQVVEGSRPQLGDGYDQWHAIQASAADVFLTRDERLARLLARVRVNGFRVVTSVRELLSEPELPHSPLTPVRRPPVTVEPSLPS